jgi:hypothetical protein
LKRECHRDFHESMKDIPATQRICPRNGRMIGYLQSGFCGSLESWNRSGLFTEIWVYGWRSSISTSVWAVRLCECFESLSRPQKRNNHDDLRGSGFFTVHTWATRKADNWERYFWPDSLWYSLDSAFESVCSFLVQIYLITLSHVQSFAPVVLSFPFVYIRFTSTFRLPVLWICELVQKLNLHKLTAIKQIGSQSVTNDLHVDLLIS